MTRGKPDYWLFAIALSLCTIGLAVVYSASYPRVAARTAEKVVSSASMQLPEAPETPSPLESFRRQGQFAIKHAIFIVLGLLVLGLLLNARLDRLAEPQVALALLGVSVGLLALTFTGLGNSNETFAHRWLSLGPVTIQPSEIAKLTLAIYLAAVLARAGAHLNEPRRLVGPFVATGLVLGLVLMQPHLGGTMMLTFIAAAVFYVAGLNARYWAILISVALFGLTATLMASPYQRERLTAFLDPLAHAQGPGLQIIRATTALSRGGISGRGMGRSIEKFDWLPECHSDSIVAVLGEEFGLLGTATVLLLFVLLGYRGLRIATQRSDRFGRLLAVGLTAGLVGQGLLNIGVTSGLLPQTGVGLPFISFGGSSLVVCLAAVGLLLNLSMSTGGRPTSGRALSN